MTSPSLRLASGGRGPARRTPCGWPCLLPGHVFGRPLDRLDDVVIAGAPAEVAFQLVADLLLGGARIALEELGGRQDHARRAEATLQAMLLPETLLDRMEIAVLGEPFDGRDRRAVRLHREERARLHRLPVHEDRSEEHTSELQSLAYLVCRLLLEKKKKNNDEQCISIVECPSAAS